MAESVETAPGLSGSALLAGVMGWPVSHSLSPRLHGYWLARHGIDGTYLPLAVPPDQFDTAVSLLPTIGWRGFNVTIPYKERILPLLDRVDAAATRLGAVNTVVCTEDGALEGTNTDGYGFIESLAEAKVAVPEAVLLLGAGGAARAIAFALHDAGTQSILISNRTAARGYDLCTTLHQAGAQARAVSWPPVPADLAATDLLVNTTALGMSGQPRLDLALDGLPQKAAVADIVYNPLHTDLLIRARAAGHPTVDGLGMLLHQARAGFALWYGQAVTVDADLRAMMIRCLTTA